MSDIYEKHVFVCAKKGQDTLDAMLEQLLMQSLSELIFCFDDRPDERFDNFSSRSLKIIKDAIHGGKLTTMGGSFSSGGCFSYSGGRLTYAIPTEDYNFEVVDSLKNLLSPLFPIALLRNPFIWGITLYLPYTRERLFDTRNFSHRSQLLEEPEVDIFRRDEGVIYKLRFHLRDEPATMDDGIKELERTAIDMREAVERRNYEGLEMLNRLCVDAAGFRRYDPRTKLGRELKQLVRS